MLMAGACLMALLFFCTAEIDITNPAAIGVVRELPWLSQFGEQWLTNPNPQAAYAMLIGGTNATGSFITNNQSGATLPSGTFTNGNFTGTFGGNGSNLLLLNPTSLTAGTANINISGSAATANSANFATSATSATTAGSAQLATNVISGISITNPVITGGTIAGTFTGNGSGVTGVNANTSTTSTTSTNSILWGGILTNSLSYKFNLAWINNSIWTEVWLSPMLPYSNSPYQVTSWTGVHGNALTGVSTYDPLVANGNPVIDGFTGNNVLTNFSILGSQYTNCGSIIVAFWCPLPASPPSTLQILLNASYNGNTTSFTLSPHGQSGSLGEVFNDTWTDSSGTRGGTLAVDGNANDCIHIYSAMWTNGVFQDFIDGKVINNYPNGAYYQAFTVPVQLAGSLYIGNNYALSDPLTVGGVYAIAISTNYVGLQQENQAIISLKNNLGINRPTINLIGDSMWLGVAGWGKTIIDYMGQYLQGFTIDDSGVSGATSAQVLSNQLYMAQLENTGTKTFDYFWCNGNNDGTTITSVLGLYTNNMMLMAQSASSNGCVPLAVVPPSNPYTDSTGLRFALDGWFITNGPSYFANIANLGLYPAIWQLNDYNIGYSNQFTNAVYFAVGGPHLTNNGNGDAILRLSAAVNQTTTGSTNVSGFNCIGTLSFIGPLCFNGTNYLFYMNGGQYPSEWINTVSDNAFLGALAGALITTGTSDTGIGEDALNQETSGSGETAIGGQSLSSIIGGTRNTAVGQDAFQQMTGGSYNVGVGQGIEAFFTGSLSEQTAIGYDAGLDIEGGSGGDIYLGYNAGSTITNANSNIDIGNQGLAGDGLIIRIGTSQTNVYISGKVQAIGGFVLDIASNSWSLVSATNNPALAIWATRLTSSNGIPVSIYNSNGVAIVNFLGASQGGILP